jgi:hypothetical protein
VNVIMLAMPAAVAAAAVMAIVILAATRYPRHRSRYGPSLWGPPGDARPAGKPQPGGLMRSIWDPPSPQGGVFQPLHPLHPPLARGKG